MKGPRKGTIALWVTLLAAALTAACGTKRPARGQEVLLQLRVEGDRRYAADLREITLKVLGRARAEYDEYAEGRRPEPPAIDVLIISGGGDWGAFGAGFLRGWMGVPRSDPLAMPDFDIVTGVSTGALIAPFAFLETEESIDRVVALYRNPGADWVKQRWPLYFLPSNISFAEVPGLEREVRQQLTPEMVRAIAERGTDGRVLLVNTTNLDDASSCGFDLAVEARRAVETGDRGRLDDILLASAGIPGAFPYREIDGAMHVDGGVTANIMYGGRVGEDETLAAVWRRVYPGAPSPKFRYWVIFNNQLRTLPETVEPRWPAIVTRSLELATRSATVTAMRHLHCIAEITRLKYGADIEVRIVAVPGDWTAPEPGVFMRKTMNELADLGERMGADPGSWLAEPP